ncbi:unnamed protein product, partial [Mesorhabditis spiculigera]
MNVLCLALFCCFVALAQARPQSRLEELRNLLRIRKDLEEAHPWASRDFVKPIGSIAGEPIYPRRFESNVGVASYTFDENGIAYARRPRPTVEQILQNSRKGFTYMW